MALWGFKRESTQVVDGANTAAGRAKGYQSPFVGGDASEMSEKRNVIATTLGWVRRENRTTSSGTNRQIDQIVVAANPGSGLHYTSNSNLGPPDIAQIYVKLNANGVISSNATFCNLYVVFNTPIAKVASGNLMSITIANVASGNNAVARLPAANTAAQGHIVNANNTLVFRMPPLQGGTYRVAGQSIAVTGNPLYNPDIGIPAAANLVISGATSNNLLDGIGNRVRTFWVRTGG